MSKPRVIKVTFIDPYESDVSDVGSSIDPTYIPSQTPESEDYSSLESSQYSVCSVTSESCISDSSSCSSLE